MRGFLLGGKPMRSLRWMGAALAVLVTGACSKGRECDVPRGTPLSQLPVLGLIDVGHGSVDSEGRFVGFTTCCSAELPYPDAGCVAACTPPRIEVYRLGPPYGEGSCPDQAEYGDGYWECDAYAVDGGVVASSGVCID